MLKISGRTITLDNFSLMRDGSPVYYAENFITKDYGFGKVLFPSLCGSRAMDNLTDTLIYYAGNGYSRALAIESISYGGLPYHCWIDENSNVWFASMHNYTGQKLINNNETCYCPDVKSMGSGVNTPILFTRKAHVGIISRGKATGGSATTLIDTTRDFTAGEFAAVSGHGALAAGDRVYNITQNKLFTINAGGIAATTLTITAVTTGTFAVNDYYLIVNPDWGTLSDDNYEYGRQITELDGDFYILDGDAIAKVSSTLVFEANFKNLDTNWITMSSASNGDTIAIVANSNSLGKIYFWDKSSYGWNKKILWENTIDSIVNYGNGYIFFSNNALYFTDGYSNQKLSSIPDCNARVNLTLSPKGMILYDHKVILNIQGYISRGKTGIYLYNIKKDDWGYAPFDPNGTVGSGKTSYEASSGCIFFDSLWNRIYYSFNTGGYGWTNSQCLTILMPEEGNVQSCVIFQPVKLGKNATIKKIEVNLVTDLLNRENYTQTISIDCKLSDGKRHLWSYAQDTIDETDLSQITVDGSGSGYNSIEVGDEVFAINGWNGFLRRTISSITNKDTSTEIWNLDTPMPNLMKQHTMLTTSPFRRCGMTPKTITITDAGNNLGIQEFYPSFNGDNVMVQIYMLATSNSFFPAIQSVKIYYE